MYHKIFSFNKTLFIQPLKFSVYIVGNSMIKTITIMDNLICLALAYKSLHYEVVTYVAMIFIHYFT